MRIVQVSTDILDNFFAPNLSNLNRCGAPEVEPLPSYQFALALNSALVGVGDPDPTTVLVNLFIGRFSFAIDEYRRGRSNLLDYVSALPQHDRLVQFRTALAHFESCILNLHVSFVSLNRIGKVLKLSKPSLYSKLDGSEYARIAEMSNRIKHFDEDVAEGVAASEKTNWPVWITNQGLESRSCSVSFVELIDVILTQGEDARYFAETFFYDLADRRFSKRSAPTGS